MKTNRTIMFFVIFLCSWLGCVGSEWPEEPENIAPGRHVRPKYIPPQVVVVSPNEGQTFYGGQTCNIGWKTTGILADSKMKIEFIRSDGAKQTLGDNLSSSGNFLWKINEQAFLKQQIANPYGGPPSHLPQNTQGMLKLTASSGGKTFENEKSISLLMPGLKIMSPKEGDIWHVGNTYAVTWQNIGAPRTDLQISIGADAGKASIVSYSINVINTGSASINLLASALFANWTGNYWLSVMSPGVSFPESYIHDQVKIQIIK